MRTLKMYPTSINGQYVDEIVDALRDGRLIIYPTDTYYAVGCDALSNRAVERVCKLKGIDPRRHPLSLLCADISQASSYARIDNNAFGVIRRLTPGPFTFILPGSPSLPKVFKGRREVGIRIPDSPIARAIALALGHPMMTASIPSDEIDGHEISYTIDGGETPNGDSTIISLLDSSEPKLLRQGLGEWQ